MPEITNVTEQPLSYKNRRFLPGEAVEVSDEDATYLIETYPERYQVGGRDRMVRGGRNREMASAEAAASTSKAATETETGT